MTEQSSERATNDARPTSRELPRVTLDMHPSFVWMVFGFAKYVFVLAFALVLAGMVLVQLGVIDSASKRRREVEEAKTKAQEEVSPEKLAAAKALAEARAEEQFARTKNQELHSAATTALEVADAAEKERVKFEEAKEHLLDGDDGKRLAKKLERVALLRAVINSPRASATEAKDVRLRLTQLADMASERTKGPEGAVAPTAELFESVDSLRERADAVEKSYREANEELDSLTAAAKADGDAGDFTKAQTARLAILDITRREAERRAARIEETRKKTEEEETQRLVAAEEEATRKKAELARTKREEELKRDLAEAEYRQKEERLWKIARSPRAKELLYPAVARGPEEKSPTSTWKRSLLGLTFNNRRNFIDFFRNSFPQLQGQTEYEQRDEAAKREFGLTLHELFRQICLRDQENSFLTTKDVARFIEQTRDPDLRHIIAQSFPNGTTPPAPLVKPDWVKD